jgi:hypothetical protein
MSLYVRVRERERERENVNNLKQIMREEDKWIILLPMLFSS